MILFSLRVLSTEAIFSWLSMFESHSMSNLEPIIESIIYLENDTQNHINLELPRVAAIIFFFEENLHYLLENAASVDIEL